MKVKASKGRRNTLARALESACFRHRVVKSRKVYSRKQKHKNQE